MKGIIYKATSPSGKVYIGQTIKKLNIRRNSHFHHAFNKNSDKYHSHFSRAIRKYGRGGFIWEVIYDNIPYKKLSKLEIKTIVKYNSYKHGYNSTEGGEGAVGLKMTEEAKAKISKANRGRKVSKKTKKRISEFNIGNIHSEATKKKIGDAHRGKVVSKKSRIKMSKSHSGENNHNSKLTYKKVKEIRRLKKQGYSVKDLAKKYEISESVMYGVVSNRSWKI